MERSFSSSAPVLAPKRMESPKSFTASPGITVSRSITQRTFPVVLSIRTLLDLVSLCVTRSGSSPASNRSPSTQATSYRSFINRISCCTPAALPHTSSSTAFSNAANRALVSWKPAMVSVRVSAGKSASILWKLPKATAL